MPGRPGYWRGAPGAALRLKAAIESAPRSANWRDVACLEWGGPVDKDGYPKLPYDMRTVKASRLAFFFDRGYWPAEAVCHRCDNRKCIHPDHFFEGSTLENVHDAFRKGRRKVRGDISNIDSLDVARVYDLAASRIGAGEIALWLNCGRTTVYRILRGERASHA